jgi:hypothetical protein
MGDDKTDCQRSEIRAIEAGRSPRSVHWHPKPNIPIFHHSNIPGYKIEAKPNGSDLAHRTRFLRLKYNFRPIGHKRHEASTTVEKKNNIIVSIN